MIKAYIGLDVHKAQTVIGMALRADDPFAHGKCSSDIRVFMMALRKALKKYDLKKEEVKLCYEAGPCGFPLARHLLLNVTAYARGWARAARLPSSL